jgi:uncharacterized membrane-anchored protein
MRRDITMLAAALSLQVAAAFAIPVQESWVRERGTEVRLAVQPVDPYDALRGYAVTFTYPAINAQLPGFDTNAAEGSTAYVILERPRNGDPARPLRLSRRLPAPWGMLALRVQYHRHVYCANGLPCSTLLVRPNTWYIDERLRKAAARAISDGQAVAELRVTPDGEASLMALRVAPSAGTMGLER